jgi:UDP-3-O-[3-hydroxymyristoyl] glucosamine N-acyltransferase
MKRTPLIIFGLTSFSEMVAHYFEAYSDHEVVAFSAHAKFVTRPELAGRPIVPLEELTQRFSPTEVRFFAGIEYKWLNAAREEIVADLMKLGFSPASFVHPHSRIAPNASLGMHNFVMEDVTLSYRSKLGSNNIVFPGTIVGAEASVGDHNYILQRLSLSRFAEIGRNCVIGADVSINEGIKVGDWCYLRTRMNVETNVATGTTYNPLLRSPGFVVDRRVPQTA